MRTRFIPEWLPRFLRRQMTYLLTALAVVAIFWAITGQGPSLAATLIYSFVLGNVTGFTLETVHTPWPASRWSLVFYFAVLLFVIPAAVALATAVVFVAVPPIPLSSASWPDFWQFLMAGWKFPLVATAIYGGGYIAYLANRNRLEGHNRQLEQTIAVAAAERELDAAELRQAREIQRNLLPKEIPQLAEFHIAGIWEPAKLVGGDYYDVIPLARDRVGICIADVVGKGISAALLMANIQASLRAFASEAASPARVCSRINSVLCTNLAAGKFATLFYGLLDAPTRTLRYTNAGHLRPILIAQDGRVRRLENGGALLGVFADWKYAESCVSLQPGDLLLLFTDGITEAMSPEGSEFGEDRLLSLVAGASWQTLEDLQSQVLDQVKAFSNHHLSDDATLLLLSLPCIAAGVGEPLMNLARPQPLHAEI